MKLNLLNGDTLKAVCAGAKTSADPAVCVKYRDQYGKQKVAWTSLNGVTAVTLLSGPSGAADIYVVDSVTILNTDTGAITVTLTNVVSSTTYTLDAVTLQVGDKLTITDDVRVVDSAGSLKSGAAGPALINVPIGLHASKVIHTLFVARDAWRVDKADYTVDIAQGGALTATFVKATGTATPASATTPIHAAAGINLNGTAHTVQPLTLTSTAADLLLAAGDRLAVVLSGAMTVGSGLCSFRLQRA